MSKLPKEHQFIDLSDYGRSPARIIAQILTPTIVTPVQVTYLFVICGLWGVWCMYHTFMIPAALLFILKSILDAADGELARLKKTPSYTGRYLDSISDILLNAIIIYTIGYMTHTAIWLSSLAFIGIQLQGTLYNYYYVILRDKFSGDTTSRIIEIGVPEALPREKQSTVTVLYFIYRTLYGIFDKIIYAVDPKASQGKAVPSIFMTAVSTFGLGFQLLLISVFLVIGKINWILPFFIGYTIMVPIFIVIRRFFIR